MIIDKAFIPSAGLGTRMGKIGAVLPKVLWPVFERRLIELQIAYVDYLGAKKIFINLHAHKEKIKDFIKHSSFLNQYRHKLIFLEEEVLLGNGGAIHNLHNIGELNGTLLINNADQFMLFDKATLQQEIQYLKTNRAVLFGTRVNSNDGHNILDIDSKLRLRGIIKNQDLPRDVINQTYSGLSIVNLNNLNYRPGKTLFFDSVANYKNETVRVAIPDRCEYWDFGTLALYTHKHFKILEGQFKDSLFYQFLTGHGAIVPDNIHSSLNSYGKTNSRALINLTAKKVSNNCGAQALIIDGNFKNIEAPGLYFNDLHQGL